MERTSTTTARAKYNELLKDFGADVKPGRESVQHLLTRRYTLGQARNAVYQFRKDQGLIKPRNGK